MNEQIKKSLEQDLKFWADAGVDFLPRSTSPNPSLQRRGDPAILPLCKGEPEGVDHGSRWKELERLRINEIGDCTRCQLHKGRTHLVFGVGNPEARLMFVGEGPGADEDAQGEPFVGRAGQLLTKMIEAMGLKRSDVYIANIIKCLRYNAMVQLGDGSWERIGRLVRKRYDGEVMSVDASGRIVPRKVIGWHATPLGERSVYQLSYQSAKNAGGSKIGIQLTGDHPILTNRGYVKVEDLRSEESIAIGQGFSKTIKNLVYGSLLGDGHIASHRTLFSFSHSKTQASYARFKAELLRQELGCQVDEVKVAAGGEQMYPIVKCYTDSHRSLRLAKHFFYGSKKRVPEFIGTDLNPMMLAFWFMDDGYMRIRPGRRPIAEIATCAFSHDDIDILLGGLSRLGLQAYERANRIFFDVVMSKKLSEVIAPYTHPSMRYKLHPEIQHEIPFRPDLFSIGVRETLFDRVEVKRLDFNGSDKTFFCIDVEETNNFVTTGGVVHNCRPPGNRNPEPVEIATCLPFLKKQIDIIQPAVIVCLGKIAAQSLLQTEIPITKLRGQLHEYGDAKVMPTYHPAFLLRNPPMKKFVWEDLKKVMEILGLKTPGS